MHVNQAPALAIGGLVLLTLAGCARQADAPATPASPPMIEVPADWFGRWTGPEGTWLEITAAAGKYQVRISNLDGPRVFSAVAVEEGLSFQRDGVAETLRATDGPGTGMKWLLEKTRCLTVRPGEGFCRD
jgi:hypothetical protein